MPPESYHHTEIETEEITINCTWTTSNQVTVPKGWRPTSSLDDFPEEVLNTLTTADAELTDWNSPTPLR
jgi:hypothetical protein